MTVQSYVTHVEANIPAFRKQEFRKNCLLASVAALGITWLTLTGLGLKGIGPLSLSTFSRKAVVLSGLCTVMTLTVLFRINAVHRWGWDGFLPGNKKKRLLAQEEIFLGLKELRPNEKVVPWNARNGAPEGAPEHEIEYLFFACKEENGDVDLTGWGTKNYWMCQKVKDYALHSDYRELKDLDLRIRRNAYDLFYPIGIFALLMVSGALLGKYRFGQPLHLTVKQANHLILVHGIIAALSFGILALHKRRLPSNEIHGYSIDDFSKNSFGRIRRELPEQKFERLENAYRDIISSPPRDVVGSLQSIKELAQHPHIPDIEKLRLFVDLVDIRRYECKDKDLKSLDEAIASIYGRQKDRWKISETDRTRKGGTREYYVSDLGDGLSHLPPPIKPEDFVRKFEPPLEASEI